MQDDDVYTAGEKGLKMSGHQERLLKAAQQLVNRLKSIFTKLSVHRLVHHFLCQPITRSAAFTPSTQMKSV